MPSGVIHDRITIRILPWLVGMTYGLTRSAELTLILSGSYLFSGMMFGPDLDINSIQYKRWGLIRGIWLPYRKFLRHRSILSHGLIIGTCVRLGYLFVIIALISILVVAIAQLLFGFTWNWQDVALKQLILINKYYQETIAVGIGLEVGAMSHSISDWISSRRKLRSKSKLNQSKSATKKTRPAKIYQAKE